MWEGGVTMRWVCGEMGRVKGEDKYLVLIAFSLCS